MSELSQAVKLSPSQSLHVTMVGKIQASQSAHRERVAALKVVKDDAVAASLATAKSEIAAHQSEYSDAVAALMPAKSVGVKVAAASPAVKEG